MCLILTGIIGDHFGDKFENGFSRAGTTDKINLQNKRKEMCSMSEINSNGLSVSFRVDSGYLDHNNRVITAHNVDISRTSDNITYTKIELRDFYQQVFGEAIMEYNLKQERPDREIHDYYEQVKKSKKVKLFYEVVVQFGDLHDC